MGWQRMHGEGITNTIYTSCDVGVIQYTLFGTVPSNLIKELPLCPVLHTVSIRCIYLFVVSGSERYLLDLYTNIQ